MGLSASHHSLDNIDFDNKEDDQHDQRLLSQFGIWFLVGVSSGGGLIRVDLWNVLPTLTGFAFGCR